MGRPRLGPRAVVAAAAVGVIAAAAELQRRHLRAIARDEDYQRLRAPLDGRPLRVTSADGTELYAEVFGPDDGDTVVLAHGWTEQIAFWGPVIGGLRVVGHSLGAMSIAAWAENHDPRARAGAAALVNTGLGDHVTGATPTVADR